MDNKIFDKLKFDYNDIAEAVRYGFEYNAESQHDGIVPDGNIKQWVISNVKKSADEWQRLTPNIVVIDPDGWKDAESHKVAWYEDKITYQEYEKRRYESTCQFKKEEI